MTTFNSQKNVLKHLGEMQRGWGGGGPTHNPRMKKGADHSIFLKSHKVSQKRFEIFASNATRGAQQPCRQEREDHWKFFENFAMQGVGQDILFSS